MRGYFFCLLATLVAFTACKRQSAPPAEAPAQQATPTETTPTETPPPPPPPGEVTAPDPTTPSEPLEPPKEIETINSKLNEYLDEGKPLPKDVADLVRLKIVTRLPPAPPGKKLVIDQTKRRVIMVNQ